MVSRRYLLVIAAKGFVFSFVTTSWWAVSNTSSLSGWKNLFHCLNEPQKTGWSINCPGHARHRQSAIGKRKTSIRFIRINFIPNMAAPAAPCFSQINRLTITALEATPYERFSRQLASCVQHVATTRHRDDSSRFYSLKKKQTALWGYEKNSDILDLAR